MDRDRSPLNRNRNGSEDMDSGDVFTKVYVSNLPFEAKWQQVKDLFSKKVGEVKKFDLFKNEKGLSRGCGILEFPTSELAKSAIQKMDKFQWLGRKMYVKKSEEAERDEFGRIISGPMARIDKSNITNDYRIIVSNLPLDLKWQDLKDIFREQIGDVTHAKLYTDATGRPRGAGSLEFSTIELAKEAIRKMNGKEIRGHRVVVERLGDEERDKFGYVVNKSAQSTQRSPIMQTYGLTMEFLVSLGIDGPLHNKLHVTNLEFRVDEKKLRQVFMIAGQVVAVEICRDSTGNSRGFGSVIYNHPLEAVQAISMLNNQTLYGRPLTIRLDREPDKDDSQRFAGFLPEGLGGVGMGLGPNGAPLKQFPKVAEVQQPSMSVWEPNVVLDSAEPKNISGSGYSAMGSSALGSFQSGAGYGNSASDRNYGFGSGGYNQNSNGSGLTSRDSRYGNYGS